MRMLPFLAALCLSLWSGSAAADTVRVAVAANFAEPMQALAKLFAAGGHAAVASTGSTGQFYAQIKNGAPFDVLLSADRATPEKLEAEGFAAPGTRFTYAIGRLALYSAEPNRIGADGRAALRGEFRKLAIANPELAPYGVAAQEALTALGLWEALRPKLVLGQNVGQTFQFVASGNAELGFVALSQIAGPNAPKGGSTWEVPLSLYRPIEQDAVLLRRAESNPAARALLEFLRAPRARELIASYGYGVE
jgi:molybdate transport system substrate-binding protein